MLAARAGGREELSFAGIRPRLQARAGRRPGPEHRRDGRLQPGQQLESRAEIAIRNGDHATTVARSSTRAGGVPRIALSGADDYRRGPARAGVQLSLRRSGNAGPFAAVEIG